MEGPFELFVGDLMTANEAAAGLSFSIMLFLKNKIQPKNFSY